MGAGPGTGPSPMGAGPGTGPSPMGAGPGTGPPHTDYDSAQYNSRA
jgi:hypothetical protein